MIPVKNNIIMKFSDSKISYSKQDEIWKEFCSILSEMKTTDEVFRFLKDLLNRQERLMIARRLHIAYLLFQGLDYKQIAQQIKTGKNTITKVSKLLKFGRNGYKKAIKRLEKNNKNIDKKIKNYYH